jgi:hypothetical protein
MSKRLFKSDHDSIATGLNDISLIYIKPVCRY